MAEDIFRIVIYLFITLACIYWAGEPFISTGTVAVTTGDRVTNIFLYLAFFCELKENGSERGKTRRGGGGGTVCGARHQSDHSVVWEKLPSSVIQRCTAA